MKALNYALAIGLLSASNLNAGIITVGQFLNECRSDLEPCMAFVMGVVEGARHQTREEQKGQPYSFSIHGKLVCLPNDWGSQKLTQIVLDNLSAQPHVHRYSAVSGVVYALAQESGCTQL
jgi:hypothetical protein